MPIYPLLDILEWIVHGWWQRLIVEAGLPSWLNFTEPPGAPGFWLDVYPEWLWQRHLTDGKPDWWWCYYYTNAAQVALNNWLVDKANRARDTAVSWVRAFTGHVSFGYTTFQVWLTALRGRVGTWVPHWATDLADAAYVLYRLFPRVIRYRWRTWDDLFDDIKAAVRAWAISRYDLARTRAFAAFDWLISTGQAVAAWWREVRWWIDDFRRNPAGYIAGQLGTTWLRLAAFARLALDYYSSLWSYHAQDLADFLADPGGWLWDKLEAEIVRRW